MIQYALKCRQGHSFDSWFQSASAYEKLASAGMVTCAVCGGTEVEKAIMSPSVQADRKKASEATLSQPLSPAEQAMKELREKVEQNSEYVGMNFATEARSHA